MRAVPLTELFLFSEPVSISKGLQDETVAVGTTVSLRCAAHGSPAPALTWLHNAAPLRASPRHFLLGSSLQIRGVTMQDSGVYQCVADNGVGFAQSAGRLHVQAGRSTAGLRESKSSVCRNCESLRLEESSWAPSATPGCASAPHCCLECIRW